MKGMNVKSQAVPAHRAEGTDQPGGTPRMPLAARAEQELRRAIVSGDLLPGAPLIEADLVQRMQMSKTPIREALRLLAHSGLVSSDAFRTWRVSRLSAAEIRDIYEVRSTLETMAVRNACTAGNSGRRAELAALIDQARHLMRDGSLTDLAMINRTLHRTLVADCGNNEIIRVLNSYDERLCLAIVSGWQQVDTSAKEFDEHRAIVEAFIRGEADQAAALMHAHIERYARLHTKE